MKSNQRGFSVVEGLLLLVIVGLIAGVGLFVRSSQQKINKTLDDTAKLQEAVPLEKKTSEAEKQTDAASPTSYLAIKEWGVKIPQNKLPEGFSYSFSADGKVGRFRSKALNDISGSCDSNSVNVARGTAKEIPPNETNSSETNFEQSHAQAVQEDSGPDVANTRDIHLKIGNYFYIPPGYSGSTCLSDPSQSSIAKEGDAMMAIIKALNLMVAAN